MKAATKDDHPTQIEEIQMTSITSTTSFQKKNRAKTKVTEFVHLKINDKRN